MASHQVPTGHALAEQLTDALNLPPNDFMRRSRVPSLWENHSDAYIGLSFVNNCIHVKGVAIPETKFKSALQALRLETCTVNELNGQSYIGFVVDGAQSVLEESGMSVPELADAIQCQIYSLVVKAQNLSAGHSS